HAALAVRHADCVSAVAGTRALAMDHGLQPDDADSRTFPQSAPRHRNRSRQPHAGERLHYRRVARHRTGDVLPHRPHVDGHGLMSGRPVIRVEQLTKEYRLGTINHGTLRRDLQSWWARVRGKPDPNALIREEEWLASSEADAEPAPEAEDLQPRRDRFLALDDVSFEVHEGETFGIIGKNGAGKSTLLKVLCRVTAPSAGRARIRGRIASLLEVGTGFHPELTGRENVFLNGAILGMTRDEIRRKFDDIVAFSQLERFIDTPVKRYSSGMYVRLAFSVAAHLDAEVLIVDEVLAVGDYE